MPVIRPSCLNPVSWLHTPLMILLRYLFSKFCTSVITWYMPVPLVLRVCLGILIVLARIAVA